MNAGDDGTACGYERGWTFADSVARFMLAPARFAGTRTARAEAALIYLETATALVTTIAMVAIIFGDARR